MHTCVTPVNRYSNALFASPCPFARPKQTIATSTDTATHTTAQFVTSATKDVFSGVAHRGRASSIQRRTRSAIPFVSRPEFAGRGDAALVIATALMTTTATRITARHTPADPYPRTPRVPKNRPSRVTPVEI
jgi:hypothetical protein|tara:strand:+ start:771 stop:1166 length:396 start_codon:yes stop_codon:yes gene_type:complete